MQFRSIISLFLVSCLIIVAFFGNVAESEKPLHRQNRNNFNSNRKSVFAQRLRRGVRTTHRHHKRQNDDGTISGDGNGDGFSDGNLLNVVGNNGDPNSQYSAQGGIQPFNQI